MIPAAWSGRGQKGLYSLDSLEYVGQLKDTILFGMFFFYPVTH